MLLGRMNHGDGHAFAFQSRYRRGSHAPKMHFNGNNKEENAHGGGPGAGLYTPSALMRSALIHSMIFRWTRGWPAGPPALPPELSAGRPPPGDGLPDPSLNDRTVM